MNYEQNETNSDYEENVECDNEPGFCDSDDEDILPIFIPKTNFSPMPHQHTALEWMKRRELDNEIPGGILALSPGLGKTYTSLYHSFINSKNDKFPTLIICPRTTVYTWSEEIRKFFGNSLSVLIFRKDNPKFKDITIETIKLYNVVITNYEFLRGVSTKLNIYDRVAMTDVNGNKFGCNVPKRPVLRETKGEGLLYSIFWSRIIADESHAFCNHKTSLWQAVMGLCGTYKFCLSGTCIKNSGVDLYSQMKFLGFYETEFNVKDFHNKNLSEYLLHIDYPKANIKLPDCNHKRIACEITDKQAEVYNMFLNHTKEEFRNFTVGTSSFASVFVLFLRLRQVSIAAFTVCPESSEEFKKGKLKINIRDYETAQKNLDRLTLGLSSWIRDKNGSAGLQSSKIVKATEIIKTIKKGEKIIVFSMFKRVLDLMVEKMNCTEGLNKSYIFVDGNVTGALRDKAIDSFKNENVDILFVSYKIGSESLNLVCATHIILMENWYNNSVTEQAVARALRMGQTKTVNVYELYTPSTSEVASIEQAIYDLCQHKKQIVNDYLNNGKSEGSKMNAATLGKILNVRRGVDGEGEKVEKRRGLYCN